MYFSNRIVRLDTIDVKIDILSRILTLVVEFLQDNNPTTTVVIFVTMIMNYLTNLTLSDL